MTSTDVIASERHEQRKSILARWRGWLEHDTQRGARAELKRCTQVGMVLCHPAALRLYSQLQEHSVQPHADAVGVIAGVAPWLKRLPEDKSELKEPDLPVLLGQPAQSQASEGGRPRFSELRFKRLLDSQNSDDLLRQTRRALAQTNGAGDWFRLVDMIIQCHRQWANSERYIGSQQWQYRWSRTYYNEVFKYLKESNA